MEFLEGYNYRINIVGADSSIIVDSFTGLIKGCIADSNDNIIIDTVNKTIDADVISANIIKGNLVSASNKVVYDNFHNSILNIDLLETKTINAEVVNSDAFNVGKLSAKSFTGNISNNQNQVIFDSFNSTIQNIDSVIAENFYGTFTGKFYGNQKFDSLDVGNRLDQISGTVNIYNDKDIDDDFGPLSIYTAKDSNKAGAITFVRSRGTTDEPAPIKPGDKLHGILFGAQTGDDYENGLTPMALIDVGISANSNMTEKKIFSEISFQIADGNGGLTPVLLINSDGRLKTVIEDLTIVGNTANVPSNSSSPDSWLEVHVNGNKKFIPLYS
jgi:hypothetical protein